MKTNPLPPVSEDPAVVRGIQVGRDYEDAVQEVRRDPLLSDLAKARKIDALFTEANAERARLYADLQGRRKARLQELEAQLPIGPGIAEGTSPADKAVLLTAFRASVEAARAATSDQLAEMLSDSVRFGDEGLRRAVYTVSVDQGRTGLAMRVPAGLPDAELLGEIGELSAALARQGVSGLWDSQAFRPLPKPGLPALEQAAQAAQAAQELTSQGFGWR